MPRSRASAADLRAAAVHDADAGIARHQRHDRHASSAALPPSFTTVVASRRVLRVECHVLGRERRRVQLGAPVAAARSMRILTSCSPRAAPASARAPSTSTPSATSWVGPTQTAMRAGSRATPQMPSAREHPAPVGVAAVQRAAHEHVLADRAHRGARLVVVGAPVTVVVREAARRPRRRRPSGARRRGRRGRRRAPQRAGLGARSTATPEAPPRARTGVSEVDSAAVDRDTVERSRRRRRAAARAAAAGSTSRRS